jgi:hypothetical protein
MKKQEREIGKISHTNHLAELNNRARSLTVGTAFGGICELSMRKNGGEHTYVLLQPVEVIELIHQLAANVGCHIHLQPRRDFASWRDWKYTEEELAHYRGVQHMPGVGHPPHVNDMAPHMAVGANLPPPEQQPGLQPALMAKETQDEQTVAIEKTL